MCLCTYMQGSGVLTPVTQYWPEGQTVGLSDPWGQKPPATQRAQSEADRPP